MDSIDITPENRRINVLREASHVELMHTVPHHGSYTVGQHAFDSVMLLIMFHPNPSNELFKAVLTDGLSKRYVGDMPIPAEMQDGELSKRLARLRALVSVEMGIDCKLTEQDRVWVKAVSKVERFLWAKDQLMLGNQNAGSIIGSLQSWFRHNRIPVELSKFITGHVVLRTPDEFPRTT